MFTRSREITDALGARLLVAVDARVAPATITISRPDCVGAAHACLDMHGAGLLYGFIMAARLALPHGLPDERIGGAFPLRISLRRNPAALVITQAEMERPFEIPATFWDKVYAELCLILAHLRASAESHEIHERKTAEFWRTRHSNDAHSD